MISNPMYKHTQSGKTVIMLIVPIEAALVILAIVLWVLYSIWFGILLSVVISLMCSVLLYNFSSLTVTIDNDFINIKFGPGLMRKSFKLADITSCTIVKNKWWYGWGIHWFPNGWLFNVWGLDAVELLMNNGKVYRIGTDEPKILNDFIQMKLKEK